MIYNTGYYGTNFYGKTAESVTEEDLKKFYVDLMKLVPNNEWEKSFIHQYIYKKLGFLLGRLGYDIEDIIKQSYIDTATESGLSKMEEEFGIKRNLNSSYEDRREVIKAKKRGQGTCTNALIRNVAEAFSGGQCKVLENTAPYTFTIQFIGVKGIPKNMKSLISTIDEIKPAHLVYDFKYTYTSWEYLDAKKLTFDDTENMTWEELEIYE